MIGEDLLMQRIKARDNFGSTIARAGYTRSEVARQANISARTLDALARPENYSRSGFTRESTAWRIARGFAQLTQQTVDEAFNALFIIVEDEDETGGV